MSSGDKYVLVDNEYDLNKILQAKGKKIALVYASWCPFCGKFLPIFQQYAENKQQHFLLIQDDQEIIADKLSVDVFPTLLFFEDGVLAKRLDGKTGIGLNEKQLAEFIQLCHLPED